MHFEDSPGSFTDTDYTVLVKTNHEHPQHTEPEPVSYMSHEAEAAELAT